MNYFKRSVITRDKHQLLKIFNLLLSLGISYFKLGKHHILKYENVVYCHMMDNIKLYKHQEV